MTNLFCCVNVLLLIYLAYSSTKQPINFEPNIGHYIWDEIIIRLSFIVIGLLLGLCARFNYRLHPLSLKINEHRKLTNEEKGRGRKRGRGSTGRCIDHMV